jgi:hypothetical protein
MLISVRPFGRRTVNKKIKHQKANPELVITPCLNRLPAKTILQKKNGVAL